MEDGTVTVPSRNLVAGTWAALPLELVAGVIFFAHGLQKLMDPSGFATKAMIPMGLPGFMAYVVIAAEFGGGLLLLTGLLVRLGALGHISVMAVAVLSVHWSNGLTGPGGFEYPLTLLAVSLSLLLVGPDPLSIDRNVLVLARGTRGGGARDGLDNISISAVHVRITGAALTLIGIVVPVFSSRLGIPAGRVALVATGVVSLVAIASGLALIAAKQTAFVPAFVVARVYLAGGVLLLFYEKLVVRGALAVAISLAVLIALGNAWRE
jgi:putative oxidoreductase